MDICKKTIMWALVVLSLISWASVKVKAAPSPVSTPAVPAAAPEPDCMTALYTMSDCLDFVTPGSNATKPDKNCCPEVAGILNNSPQCLCKLFAKTIDIGLPIDIKRALMLPKKCKLQAYDISLCSAIGIPVSAPGALAGSPSGAPTSGSVVGAPTSGAGAGAPTSGAVAGAPISGAVAGAPISGAVAGAPTSGAVAGAPTELSPSAGESAGGKNGASSSAQFNVVVYLVTAGLAMAFIHY